MLCLLSFRGINSKLYPVECRGPNYVLFFPFSHTKKNKGLFNHLLHYIKYYLRYSLLVGELLVCIYNPCPLGFGLGYKLNNMVIANVSPLVVTIEALLTLAIHPDEIPIIIEFLSVKSTGDS